MSRTVTVGFDGSPESRRAADWAAREARLRALPLRVVHVWEPVPEPMAQAPLLGTETRQHWSERVPRESAERLRLRHPGIEVVVEQYTGNPVEILCEAAASAEPLVLGSRGLGGIGGFVAGSVGLAVLARTDRPVVVVRADEPTVGRHGPGPAAGETPTAPVVLGLDTGEPDETLLGFAFEAAVRYGVPLRVVHAWRPPPAYAYELSAYAYDLAGPGDGPGSVGELESAGLTKVLQPWRQSFPGVEVVEESRPGSAARVLVEAAREAALVVVGKRLRTGRLGTHLGHVTHAVLHHVAAPVAVVPHS
ncbi:universal stress protein [Streptomyces sp. LaPpAH-108]|uniref:universal stress protein n=1 Tax=Streptomyces sp. LaPpAH-108 TaxID=1155714 RepID=UPI000367CBF3|nr:universal stress protein [Streptomyces sp. LaPpAH-108]